MGSHMNDLIKCCKGVVENEYELFETDDYEGFYKFCLEHKLANIAYLYLSGCGMNDNRISALFEDKYKQSILNDAAQQYYTGMVKEAFAENGIDYLLLKGCVIKEMYPSSELRTSADIDIYVGKENAVKAKPVMEALGFENESFGDLYPTDNYKADKFSYVELHRKLIPKEYSWKGECDKIIDRLIPKGDHEYVMSDEDFYIFMICHIAKHMKFGGIGVRAFLDVWIYLRNKKDLNWKFIDDIIEKCGLSEFHKNVRELIGYWFEDKPGSKKLEEMSDYIASSGWNGKEIHMKSSGIERMAGITDSKAYIKFKAYLDAIFMNIDVMKEKYPVLEKHPGLLPFCWVHRAVNAVFRKHNTIKNVLHSFDDVDMEKSKKINQFRKDIGV